MVFSSNLFLFAFLPFFLLFYFLVPVRFRNPSLFLVSTLFYFWGSGPAVLWLLACVVLNYYGGLWISASSERRASVILAVVVALDLALLLYFKYFNFFSNQASVLLGWFDISWQTGWQVALPLGISFFTFKAISYVVEIYRQVEKPAQKILDFGAYLTLFPQLIAGPIARYSEISRELEQRSPNLALSYRGLHRFALGLGKKVLMANTLGRVADRTFAMGAGELTTPLAWLGMLCYSFQIYYDFSGYSDMAIGIGNFLGFHFPENFNQPYRSRNLAEFWRRWHLTLSNWFRDFLFIPLEYKMARWWQLSAPSSGRWRRFWARKWNGGRGAAWRTLANLLVVFSLCGLWHGAAWSFVIWGAFHGFCLAVELVLKKRLKWQASGVAGTLFTFLLVSLGWVFFRSENLAAALFYLKALFGFQPPVKGFQFFPFRYYLENDVLFYLVCAGFFAWLPTEKFQQREFWKRPAGVALAGAVSLILIVFSAVVISSSGFNPFIYFRF